MSWLGRYKELVEELHSSQGKPSASLLKKIDRFWIQLDESCGAEARVLDDLNLLKIKVESRAKQASDLRNMLDAERKVYGNNPVSE